MRYVQVHRAEYHNPEDRDALQEARKEYDEVERQVRLEEEDKNERGERLEGRDNSEEDERLYEVLNFEKVRKIRKRPGAPKWTIRLSKVLRDYLKEPTKADEHSLADDIWRVMMKMDRWGETYLKEEWRKKQKKEKKKRGKERKKAKKTARKGKKSRRRRSRVSESSSSGSSSCSTDTLESSSSSSSSGRGSRQRQTPPASSGKKHKVEIRVVDGRQGFWSGKGQKWIDCTNPPAVPCPKCGQRHWYHEAEASGCGA